MKAGTTLTLSVNVTGAPTPNVTWFLGDEEITTLNGYSIETKDDYSTLTVKDILSEQSGIFSVVAENSVGSDRAEFTVNVIGMLK